MGFYMFFFIILILELKKQRGLSNLLKVMQSNQHVAEAGFTHF